jgi:uncharacterized protein (TIGR00255 family)
VSAPNGEKESAPLASMTGFARAASASGAWRWARELKSVNSKGLDLRLRLPPGFDSLETEVRARLGKALARGAVQAGLQASREAAAPTVRVNEEMLAALLSAVARAPRVEGVGPATMDGLLSIRGVVEVSEGEDDEAALAQVRAAMLASLDEAVAALVAMRRVEGQALDAVLRQRLDRISALAEAADANVERKPEAVRARLAEAVARLDETGRFDRDRLHQEAILLATKADVREELDRLKGHVAAARDLLDAGGPVGRRLDFLAQEFGREANTLCAKANHPSLTAQGLELRAEIEQLREQVQNIE